MSPNYESFFPVFSSPSEFDDEDGFRDWFAKVLRECNLETELSRDVFKRTPIEKVEINKKHPTRDIRPDLHIYHSGLDMEWKSLSNPFFIECKADEPLRYHLLQYLRYKYDKGNGEGLEKYGDYHVVIASPKSLQSEDPYSHTDFYSWPQLERILWQLGLGLARKRGSDLLFTFNEEEQVKVVF